MDAAEHGEGSSSPSDNITVTSVKKRAVGPFDRIELSDGSLFLLHPAFPPEFSCQTGDELSPEEVDRLVFLAETGAAWEKSLDLLERRHHSSRELHLKLKKRRFSDNAIQMVLDRLREKQLLNDVVFAEHWILSRLSRHPEGYYALLAGLKRKGVAGDDAEAALKKNFDDEQAVEAAERVWHKGERKGASRQELEALLHRRGFRRHIINSFLEKID